MNKLARINSNRTVIKVLNGWVLVPRRADIKQLLLRVRLLALAILLIPIIVFGATLRGSIKSLTSGTPEPLTVSNLSVVSFSSLILGVIVLIGLFLLAPSVPWGGPFFYNSLPRVRVSRKEKKGMSKTEIREVKLAKRKRDNAPLLISPHDRDVLMSVENNKDVFNKDLKSVLESIWERE